MTENEKLLSDLLLARDELSRVTATGSIAAIEAVKPKSDALCAAVLARMAGPQWQTMETAPKDGTQIDLWARGERLANARWNAKAKCWEWYWIDDFDGMGWVRVDIPPTHWMPLPACPNQGGNDDQAR